MSLSAPDPDSPTAPAARAGRGRVLIIGAAAAVLLGLVVGVLTLGSHRGAKDAPAAAKSAAAPVAYRPIGGQYRPLDPQQIAAAFADGRRLYAGQGLSGLANASMTCFQRLGRQPSYGLMDYCLALDVYGAQTYAAVAGDDAPASTWFGQGPVRRLAAVQALTAGATDANARMLDTSRAIQQVAAQVTPPPPAAPPPVVVAQAAPAAPPPVAVPVAPPAAPTPAAPTPAAPTPAAKSAAAAAAPRSAPAPAPAPPRPPPAAQARQAEPAPRAFRGPSFNCRYARSVTERMICGEPELAAADRRLAAEFDRAMARASDPRALRRQQDRWLAARERAGADYDAVLDLYDIRTRELREEP